MESCTFHVRADPLIEGTSPAGGWPRPMPQSAVNAPGNERGQPGAFFSKGIAPSDATVDRSVAAPALAAIRTTWAVRQRDHHPLWQRLPPSLPVQRLVGRHPVHQLPIQVGVCSLQEFEALTPFDPIHLPAVLEQPIHRCLHLPHCLLLRRTRGPPKVKQGPRGWSELTATRATPMNNAKLPRRGGRCPLLTDCPAMLPRQGARRRRGQRLRRIGAHCT